MSAERPSYSRRQVLTRASNGFGMLALAGLMAADARAQAPDEAAARAAAADPAAPKRPHFKPRAKNVIFCFMSGGVSHLDSFDPKPRLTAEAGQPMPMPVARTQFNNNGKIMPSPWAFKQYGECGMPISDLFPHIAQRADDLAVIRSMTAKFSEHAQGNFFIHSGLPFLGYPSVGAWVTYGLGSEARNLPGFVVLKSGGSGIPHGGVSLYSNGFLPAVHQASFIDADAPEPVRNIKPHEPDFRQRQRLDFVGQMDRQFLAATDGDLRIESAIRNYETAYRMQAAVPDLVDLAGESAATKHLYGLDSPDAQVAAYGRQCLLARRLVERGVRFIELTCLPQTPGGGQAANPWDQHGQLRQGHENMARQVDQPIGALLTDLKARGLLDETLVVWAGEFGRTPFSQGSDGRDHNPFGFSVWLAGGGVKGGTIYGGTDEYGYHAVDKPCDLFDLWATVLHQLGLDHQDLTYRYSGRDIRLTDVHGEVLREIVG